MDRLLWRGDEVDKAAIEMLQKITVMGGEHSASKDSNLRNQETNTNCLSRAVMVGTDLWTDGLICAFEFLGGNKLIGHSKSKSSIHPAVQVDGKDSKKQVLRHVLVNASDVNTTKNNHLDSASHMDTNSSEIVPLNDKRVGDNSQSGHSLTEDRSEGSYWEPIGWSRILELVNAHDHTGWVEQSSDYTEAEDGLTVQDVAAPYWERPVGPTWWCHVTAGHPFIDGWLSNAHWLHPAISIALRDESRLISERMKYLFYEVPVRVAGGLLFELLGQSVGDPFVTEDDIPVVIRSWQARNFLITAMHIKGTASSINVLGITEVQELLSAGGINAPRTIHEVIGHLASRLSRWDDRLFRKSIFGTADELELKFMNRRNHENMNLFSVILNQEIRWLSEQVIRVKWSLHAREEIVFELLQHLRGNTTRRLLEGVRKGTREMIEEQEAVRGRLFTIQDVMQSTVRAWLQDRSLRVTHNLTVFGGCGLVLSIITGLFGINVDGIPGADKTPYAFGIFTGILFFIGTVLVIIGKMYLGLKKPIKEDQVQVRTMELETVVKMFQHEAESHAQVRQEFRKKELSPIVADMLPDGA